MKRGFIVSNHTELSSGNICVNALSVASPPQLLARLTTGLNPHTNGTSAQVQRRNVQIMHGCKVKRIVHVGEAHGLGCPRFCVIGRGAERRACLSGWAACCCC